TGNNRAEKDGRPCLACGNWHELADCFYVFTEAALEGWRMNNDVLVSVTNKLRTDKTLREQVQKIRETAPPTRKKQRRGGRGKGRNRGAPGTTREESRAKKEDANKD